MAFVFETYPRLTGSFGLAWTTFNTSGRTSSSWPIGSNIKFGPSRGMFEIERVELFADAVKHHPSLQSLFIAGSLILSRSALLFFRLLRTDDALLSQGCLEALKLGTGHIRCNGRGMVCRAKGSHLDFFFGKILIVISNGCAR